MKRIFILITIASLVSSCGLLNPEEESKLRLSRESMNFGEVIVGTYQDEAVEITNASRSEFELNRTRTITIWVELSGDAFSIRSDSLGSGEKSIALLPGQSMTVRIRCRPRAEGAADGELRIIHNAENVRTPVRVPPTAESNDLSPEISQLIEDGWAAFDEGNYTASTGHFLDGDTLARHASRYDSLRGASLCGAGWSQLFGGNYPGAKRSLERAIDQNDIGNATRGDIRAALAFTYYHQNLYYRGIFQLERLLEDQPGYVFSHDRRIDAERMQLLLAQSYYLGGLFEECAAQLDTIYPERAPFPTDPEELLAILQELVGEL